jgi:hypothetical protein
VNVVPHPTSAGILPRRAGSEYDGFSDGQSQRVIARQNMQQNAIVAATKWDNVVLAVKPAVKKSCMMMGISSSLAYRSTLQHLFAKYQPSRLCSDLDFTRVSACALWIASSKKTNKNDRASVGTAGS